MGLILVLCRDLLLASKITGSAASLGVPVKLIRDPSALASETGSNRLLVDLNQPGFLDAAADWKKSTGGHVTGFAGHMDVATIERARQVGLDNVLARGAFVANLPELLTTGPR